MKIDSLKIIVPEQGKKFILDRIEKVINSDIYWTNGMNVREFEKEFCAFTGSKYSIAVNSGISALQAALFSLDINTDEYTAFVPTLTAPPTVYACLYSGLKVIYVDSRKEDLGMDVEDLRRKMNKYKSKKGVIIPVHISGIISEKIDEIIKIGKEYGMPVIEDCAHAHGATYRGIHAGMRGDAGAYSFFMTKVLMSGEGGVVITNQERIYNGCKIARDYGKVDGIYRCKGSNWRMSEFHAITALWQTIDGKRIHDERSKIAALYDHLLRDNKYLTPLNISPDVKSAYYKYVVFLPYHINRRKLKDIMKNKYGITLSSEVYERPCHKEPVFADEVNILNRTEAFPQSDEIANHHICLPIYPGLSNESIKHIVFSLEKAMESLI